MSTKHLANIESGVLIPAFQGGVTGVLVGGIAGILAALAGGDVLLVTILSGGISGLLSFWAGVSWWRAAIVPLPEPDPVVLPAESVRVELVRDEGHWVDWLNLPLSLELVRGAARALVENGFNTSNLGGAGRAISRAEAELLRDWLIAHELGSWRRSNAHTAGWDLTGAGRALMRRLVMLDQDTTSPTRPELPAGWAYRAELQTHTNPQGDGGGHSV